MKVRKVIRGGIAGLLCLAFLLLSFNAVYNTHSHKFDNGKVVQHAHPYKHTGNAPFKTHKHSRFELIFLEFFSLPVLLAAGMLLLALHRRIAWKQRMCYLNPLYNTYSLLPVQGRAPPAC